MKARFIALAALVLGMASCQQDVELDNPVVGGEVDFQLKVDAKELATRAGDEANNNIKGANSAYGAIDYLQGAELGDPYKVDWSEFDLRYTLEVYDVADDYTDAVPVKDRMVQIVDEYEPVAFDLRLVPNRNYHFVVFADFVYETETEGTYVKSNGDIIANPTESIEDQRYLGYYHTIGETLGDITIVNDQINGECTDAYFATQDIVIKNSAAQDIELKRPYGKVRVIATDLAELNLNVNPQRVQVDYTTEVPTTFNAVNGKIGTKVADKSYVAVLNVTKEDMSKHLYTEDYDAKTTTNADGETRFTHVTLFTDYILAEESQTPYNFTLTVFDDKAGQNVIKETHFSTDIPVQRNHLTTIIGNVLTTATEINVTINDNFDGYHDRNVVFVSSARELQEAIDACVKGTTIIFFEADIKGDVIIKQQEGINIVLNGNNKFKFDGTITINGDARANGAETLKFEGINFYTNRDNVDFIYAPTKYDGRYNYSHNITVDGCTFTAEQYNETVVGIKLQTTYNAVIKNSSAKNLHSFIQIKSTDNKAVIEDIKVENCKNGIALGNIALATIKNANITATGYGIRLDGEKTRTVAATIENATITAYIPVNIRYMNDDACNVDVEFLGENNVLAGSVYEIAFCSNEYEEGVAPESPMGTFCLQNAEEARAYYGDITTFSAFDAAINSTNSDDVKVESDITKVGLGVEVERDVTIDFDNKVFNAGSDANSYWYALEIKGDYDVTIKNANFTRAGVFAGENANVVFESGTIDHKPERSSRYIFCARYDATITVKDGTFTNDREKNTFFWADASTIIVEGGVFNGVKSKSDRVCGVTTNGGKIIIKGGTFNFDPTNWLAEGYTATKSGSTWTVSAL